jgi:hypothetical protein
MRRPLLSLLLHSSFAAVAAPATPVEDSIAMYQQASGRFEVGITRESEDASESTTLARSRLDKRYHGGLDANATGEMLTAVTATQGSAGYVAIERVTGSLDGRAGSFVLQHSGRMSRGAQHLDLFVVPDSGSGALTGLEGRMRIRIEDGQHFYDLEYRLPAAGGG